MSKTTNPNGSNQYQLDPRQKLCWEYYINPKSETFGNGRQSAMKAGYEEETANQITIAKWFLVKTRRLNMLSKGEKVLDETLEYDPKDADTGKVDIGIARIKLDAAKHVTSTLGKNEGYSTRSETDITSKGEKIQITGINYINPNGDNSKTNT